MVGAGVLAHDENGIGVLEIGVGNGAFTDAEALAEASSAGLMTHVRAVREVVGPECAAQQLVEEGSFVASPSGGVQLDLVGMPHGLEFAGDQGEGFVPGDWYVVVGRGIVA